MTHFQVINLRIPNVVTGKLCMKTCLWKLYNIMDSPEHHGQEIHVADVCVTGPYNNHL